jgi:rSAM/selenodomain-associated transferase 1
MPEPETILCLLFAKPPRPGLSKTRLATSVGPEAAARLAGAFLRDTASALASLVADRRLEIVLSTPEPDSWHGVDLPCWDQGPGELGQRLERGLHQALQSHEAALAMGADSPGLPQGHLREVLSLLGSHPAVLAPTDDGGFWALGLTRQALPVLDGLLAGLPWSSPETARATEERLRSRGLPVGLGPRWWDVDVGEDLARFAREVPREDAPETHRELGGLA